MMNFYYNRMVILINHFNFLDLKTRRVLYNTITYTMKIVYDLSWSFVALFFKFLLFVMGWKGVSERDIAALKGKPKVIFVFSHTSFWDISIFFLLRMAYPSLGKNMYTIVTPWAFERWEWRAKLLRRCNCIKATRLEDSGLGFVDSTVNFLRPKDSYFLLISPEGKIPASEWRSGYYHIAKNLGIPIRTVGLDYEQKQIRFELYRDPKDYASHGVMEVSLKQDMGEIVPLYPKGTFVPIRAHDHKKRAVINYSWFALNCALLLQFWNLYRCVISWFSLSMFFYLLPNILFLSIFSPNPNFFLGIFTGVYFVATMFMHFSDFSGYHSLSI